MSIVSESIAFSIDVELLQRLPGPFVVTEILEYILLFLCGMSGFSILPFTKIAPQATQPHETSII